MAAEEGKLGISDTEALAVLERFVVENDDLLALESLIGKFNIFDALRIKDVEIRHSNFLAFILNPAESHGQGQLFLKAVLMDLLKKPWPEKRPLSPIDLDGIDLRGVVVRREWKHIDLLIMCQEPRFFLVIENKISAQEGQDQLSRYEEAMQKHYPDALPLYVYLTVNANEPAENKWMPYSHADIYRVLKRVRKTYRKAIGDDVLVFLDHYLNLIGTRFMNESKESKQIDELCQRIYTNHRRALDLIRERVGTPVSGVLAEAKQVLEEDSRWEIGAGQNQIYFVPKTWLEWLPPFGLKADPRWWIFGILYLPNARKLNYVLDLAPMTSVEKRREIVTKLFAAYGKLGFQLPKSAAKEVKNNYSQVMPTQGVSEWDENDDPDSDAVREQIRVAVKKTLDDLYPKLEILETVLKPLCILLASST